MGVLRIFSRERDDVEHIFTFKLGFRRVLYPPFFFPHPYLDVTKGGLGIG